MNVTTLYLADDHQIIIDGLNLLISNNSEYKIIGAATDGKVAHDDILFRKPDIALIDLRMPGLDGIELINTLKKKVETKFIILSMYNERRHIANAINYGASGYLLKNTGKNELLLCLQKVNTGEKYFPSILLHTLRKKHATFSPRESDILKLVIDGYSTLQIADMLHLSHYTVETHRKNICRKANTKTVVGLLKYITDNEIEL